MSNIPLDILIIIINYFPIYNFTKIKLYNKFFNKYWLKHNIKKFRILKKEIEFYNAFMYKNINLIDNKITLNMINKYNFYNYYNSFYNIFFKNRIINIDTNGYYNFLKPYLIQHIKNNELSYGFADENKNYLPIYLYDILSIFNNYPQRLNKTYYFYIDDTFFYIKGFINNLINDSKEIFFKIELLCKKLLFLLKDHLTNYLVWEDYPDFIKTYKKNYITKDYIFLQPPKYIYCSGCRYNGKRCQSKIKYKMFIDKKIFSYYCYIHKDNLLIKNASFYI